MPLSYRSLSPKRSNISEFEMSIASSILHFDERAQFGIGDNDSIHAIFFSSPPNSTVATQISELPNVVSIGMEKPLANESPMNFHDEGCLDYVIDSIGEFNLQLFLACRFPISIDNLSQLAKLRTLKYLRLVGNISDRHVDHLRAFTFLESLTVRDCPELDTDRLLELLRHLAIPEVCLSEQEVDENQLERFKSNLDKTSIRIVR